MSPAFPRRLLALSCSLSCLPWPALGHGARPSRSGKLPNGAIDLQVFRPAVDSKGFITLNASQILAPKDFSFGLVSTWARKPLDFEGTVAGQPTRPGRSTT